MPSFVSECTIPAWPTAAMMMSASRTMDLGSGVREWTIVTVASRSFNSNAAGKPTMLLLPSTTARFPEIWIPHLSSSSMHPCTPKSQILGWKKSFQSNNLQKKT
jgi:hypothetical protein